MIRSVEEALRYFERADGMSLGLETMRRLLASLGHPEDRPKLVHIAGTNGKGSVLAYVSSALTACGMRTGRYSSPAVFDPTETIRIDGEPIPDDVYVAAANRVADSAERLEGKRPTRYELETALAYEIFAASECRYAVVETGLGGRLDATNAARSKSVAVVTSIGYDHTAFLGSTLTAIAGEKAGIFRPGVPVAIAGDEPEEAERVLRARAAESNSSIVRAGVGTVVGRSDEGQTIEYRGVWYDTRLRGEAQRINLPLAIETLGILAEKDPALTSERFRIGIARAEWEGRFDVSYGTPSVVFDGAHNPAAARRLRESIDAEFPEQKRTFVVGIFGDKDTDGMLRELSACADRILTFDWENPRALDGRTLAERAAAHCADVSYAGTLEDAIERARAETDGAVVVCGSLSHLAAAKRIWRGETK